MEAKIKVGRVLTQARLKLLADGADLPPVDFGRYQGSRQQTAGEGIQHVLEVTGADLVRVFRALGIDLTIETETP